MIFQSLNEFTLLQTILSKINDEKCKDEIDAILDDPVALASIFTLASYLKIELPDNDLGQLHEQNLSDREFMRYYLIGLSIVILELKTHNCCGIQHKFMTLYKHVLLDAAKTNNYKFIESVINS
ncbi:MAG: hypothetical protein ACXWDO_07050 [Bacteroidia bacterium]